MKKSLKYIGLSALIIGLSIWIVPILLGPGLPNHIRHIPYNTTKVFTVNTSNIIKKVALESIFDMSFYDLIIDILTKEGISVNGEGPEELGFSLFKEYYFYNVDEVGRADGYYGAIIPLENVNRFSEYMINRFKDAVETDGVFKLVNTNKTTCIAWNGEVLLLIGGHKYAKRLIKELFDLTVDESLAGQNPSFETFQTSGFEMGAWIDLEILYEQNKSKMAILESIGIESKMFNNAFVSSAFNFDDGNLDMDINLYLNQAFNQALPDLFKSGDNQRLFKNMMMEDLPLFGRLSLNTQKANKLILEHRSKFGIMGGMIIGQGVPQMLGGDMAVTLNYVGMKKQKEYNWVNQLTTYKDVPDYGYLAAISIKDKKGVETLLNSPLIMKENGYYTIGGFSRKLFVFLEEDMLYMTQSAQVRDVFQTSDNKGLKNRLNDEKFAIHVDIQQMLEKFEPEALQYFNIDQAVMISKEAETIDIQVNGMKNEAFNCEIELNLKNKKENSLYTILELYNESIKVPRFNEQLNDLVAPKQ